MPDKVETHELRRLIGHEDQLEFLAVLVVVFLE